MDRGKRIKKVQRISKEEMRAMNENAFGPNTCRSAEMSTRDGK